MVDCLALFETKTLGAIDVLLANGVYPPFLLQICPKLCYFNKHVFCLKGQPFRRNQPKTRTPVDAPLHRRKSLRSSSYLIFAQNFDADYACGAASKSSNSSKTRHLRRKSYFDDRPQNSKVPTGTYLERHFYILY